MIKNIIILLLVVAVAYFKTEVNRREFETAMKMEAYMNAKYGKYVEEYNTTYVPAEERPEDQELIEMMDELEELRYCPEYEEYEMAS